MKKKVKMSSLLALLFGVVVIASCDPEAVVYKPQDEAVSENIKISYAHTIPPGGNSWVINSTQQDQDVISDSGIHNWSDLNTVIRTYFKTTSTGSLQVGLNLKVATGQSKIKVTVDGESHEITASNKAYKDVDAGVFDLDTPGYHYIEIQGLQKSGTYIGDINDIKIGGTAASGSVTYVQNEFYWGRRGPSVHMSYTMPAGKDITWFYNEVTVPVGEDVLGSYFMADGFGEGYFGMQVNSATERRILFSVWSPYDTQNPNDIPEDYKIILLGSGEGVTIGEFGNEGSGGQSYKVYNWQAGNTYKFLLKGEPSVNNSTDYTAYFYAPEVGEWKLIASFRRPHTSTYLKGFHSFLENFNTHTGFESRRVSYSNQWVYSTEGTWYELTHGKFTADATARSGARLDYAGGSDGATFFLKNCGFFNENTVIDSFFDRTASGIAPGIDFGSLETPTLPDDPVYLDKTGWEVVDFSSEETSGEGTNGLASLIIDGDSSTYWHSCWSGCSEDFGYPHFLTVDTKQSNTADGFEFIQRNGSRKIDAFELFVSNDNVTFTSAGTFNLADTASPIRVDFTAPQTFRYFKFVGISAHDGQRFAALAEISPYTN